MINIYNLDYREFFNKLISYNITSELQIHDIPYNVSSNSESSIKFNNRSDMITDFGDWDHKDINFSQFASLCSQLGGERGSSVLVFYNNWYGLSDLVREFKKYYDKVDLLIYHKTNPRPQVRKRNFTMNFEMLIWAHRGNYTFNYKSHKENFASLNIDALYYNSVAMGKDRIKDELGKTIHPTQKPVKLIQHYIEILSNPEDTIVDAFAGVMTTGMASIRCNRNNVYLNDLDKRYCNYGYNWLKGESNDIQKNF